MNQKIFRMFLIGCMVACLAACSDTFEEGDPTPPEISVTEVVTTDQLTFSFDVIKCKGKFTVETEDTQSPTAPKITIEDHHVTVELIADYTFLKVTDESGLSQHIKIQSTHPDLTTTIYNLSQSYGVRQRYPDLKFGTGKIKILRDNQENGVAKVSIDPDGVLVIESIKPGRHSFQLSDSRGVVRYVTVSVNKGWDVTGSTLEVECQQGKLLNFLIKYGNGGWKLVSAAVETPFNVLAPKGTNDDRTYPYDWLQLGIPQDAKGQLIYKLENSDGLHVTITVSVKES